MRLAKLFLFTALIENICLTPIVVRTSESLRLDHVEPAVNCFAPVILIDRTAGIIRHSMIPAESGHKLQVFVVTATSSTSFVETLRGIKSSNWWNHLASFLILDRSIHGCSNKFEVLWSAWTMDLLAANFICLHETKGWLIYTYNPYTSKAPEPWKLENTYRGKYNHPWTLFVRSYREDDKICDNLDFDKAADLGGYAIRTSVGIVPELLVKVNPQKTGTSRFSGVCAILTWKLLHALNGHPRVLNETTYTIKDENGNYIGIVGQVFKGVSDFAVNFWYRTHFRDYVTTYPFGESGTFILTQYRGSESQLSKIASIIDSRSKLAVCLVCLITVLFFVFFLRYSPSSAILNVLLLICNAALRKIPQNLAPRIYLASIFIFVVNIQGIFQSKLAALLTQQVNLQNVDSLQDISKFDYTAYGPVVYRELLDRSAVKKINFVPLDPFVCFQNLLSDSKAACLHERNMMIGHAAEFKLHMSSEPLETLPWCLIMRKNWPPERRVNKVLRRFVEAHLIHIIYEKEIRNILNTLQATEDMKNDKSIKVLALPDLTFAFVILAIGLACASICFVVEIGPKTVQAVRFRFNVTNSIR